MHFTAITQMSMTSLSQIDPTSPKQHAEKAPSPEKLLFAGAHVKKDH